MKRPFIVVCSFLLAVVAMSALASCGRQDPAVLLEAYASQAKASRVTAASGLIAAFKAEQITAEAALNLAHEKLEQGQDATEFAGAVLDMYQVIEKELPTGGEFEIFWRRVGRLAYQAAEKAYTAERIDEAWSLVLAGPARWQNEAYFLRYSDHDALVSMIMARRGDRAEAIRRLQERPDLEGPAKEVYDALTRAR